MPLTARIAAQTGYAASILAGPNLYTEIARDGYTRSEDKVVLKYKVVGEAAIT